MATTLDLDFTITTTLDPRITFSRASLGTYYGSDGLLKYAAHNLAWPSEDFSSANWTKNAGATITVDATTAPTGATTADRLNHVTVGTVVGAGVVNTGSITGFVDRWIYSLYVKAGTKGWVGLGNSTSNILNYAFFNLTTGTLGTKGANIISAGIANAGSGWYQCWILTTGASGYVRVCETDNSVTCTSPGDIYIWGAQMENVTTATTPSTYIPTTTAMGGGPRFDYDPITRAPRGLLIEGSNTLLNGSVSSEDFVTTWTKTGVTSTADQTVAPNGTTTADLITASASPATIAENTSVTAGSTDTYSVYAKKGTSDWFYILRQATADAVGTPRAWFNLNTGVVGTVESGITAATIQDVGNGWYRCSATRGAASTTARLTAMGISDADNSATVTVGRTIYLWGKMWENNATYASSYIPHSSTAGNRFADVAVMTGTNFSSWYTQAQGTLIAEFDVFSALTNRYVIEADDNTVAERITFNSSFGGDGLARVTIVDNSVGQFGGVMSAVSLNAPHKLGVSFAPNDFAASFDGGTVVTDTSGTLPTLTQLRIGSEGVLYLNGHIRRIQFMDLAVDDATLQTLPQPPTGTVTPPDGGGGGGGGGGGYGAGRLGSEAYLGEDDPRVYAAWRRRRKKLLREQAERLERLARLSD